MQYADDTQVLISGPPQDIGVITSRLQVVLRKLAAWFSLNRLLLNVNKSQVIVFGSKATLRHVNLKTIDVFGVAVPVNRRF